MLSKIIELFQEEFHKICKASGLINQNKLFNLGSRFVNKENKPIEDIPVYIQCEVRELETL